MHESLAWAAGAPAGRRQPYPMDKKEEIHTTQYTYEGKVVLDLLKQINKVSQPSLIQLTGVILSPLPK